MFNLISNYFLLFRYGQSGHIGIICFDYCYMVRFDIHLCHNKNKGVIKK